MGGKVSAVRTESGVMRWSWGNTEVISDVRAVRRAGVRGGAVTNDLGPGTVEEFKAELIRAVLEGPMVVTNSVGP